MARTQHSSVALGLAAGLIVYGLLLLASGLTHEARLLGGVMACTVYWWISEALPLPVSALLASAMAVVLGIAPAKKVMAPYADPVIFLFMGSFWLAAAMSLHGLDHRFAVKILSIRLLNRSPKHLLAGVAAVSCVISMCVSNTATTAMLLPIVLGILAALPKSGATSKIEARMLLMLAFGASVGGIGTPIGTPPNLIGIGLIANLAHVKIGFTQWMAIAMPVMIVTMVYLVVLLGWRLPSVGGWAKLEGYLQQQSDGGRFNRAQLNTLASLATAALLWIFLGDRIPEGISAVLAASLLFLLPKDDGEPTLTWEEAVKIDWGVLLLFGGGMSLGQMMFDTKLAEWLGSSLVSLLGVHSAFGITGVSSFIALTISELANNTASANIAVPGALALAHAAQTSPLVPALAATLASSFGFILPSSTAPNAIVYGTGKVPLREMFRFGLALDVFGWLILWFFLAAAGLALIMFLGLSAHNL